MSDSEQEEPKIIVDSDWKEQVAKEKEASDAKSEVVETPASETAPAESSDEVTTDAPPPAPPATFDVLISMMFTQAMAMLGQIPDPASGESKVNKPYAKHYIDTLEMLGEKTKGNLSEEESKMLSEALHALRMMYVNAKS
ncbi:MAG: DUF1844 domain-containing protein [Rubripirellula sp.]